MDQDMTEKGVARAILQEPTDDRPQGSGFLQHPQHELEDHHRLPQSPIPNRNHQDPPEHNHTNGSTKAATNGKGQGATKSKKASGNTCPRNTINTDLADSAF